MFCMWERKYLANVVVHFMDIFFFFLIVCMLPLRIYLEKGKIFQNIYEIGYFVGWIRVQKFLSHSSFPLIFRSFCCKRYFSIKTVQK